MSLHRVVLPMREVVAGVMRQRLAGDREQSRKLDGEFADLYEHVLRAAEWSESPRDVVSSVSETDLSLQDARLNTIMKKLAFWGAIIARADGGDRLNRPEPALLGLFHAVGTVAEHRADRGRHHRAVLAVPAKRLAVVHSERVDALLATSSSGGDAVQECGNCRRRHPLL
ncbi:CorA family divalent cation transporter [Micropruina sp.]|uniref:CorA family divalent cation transporter n=1 Tax=Micropruina sp. TaxID=2737536 RepID=UPI0039E6E43B